MGFSRQEHWSGLVTLYGWIIFCLSIHPPIDIWISFLAIRKALTIFLLSIMVYYKILSIVPHATHSMFIHSIYNSLHLLIPNSQSIPSPCTLLKTTDLVSISESVSAQQWFSHIFFLMSSLGSVVKNLPATAGDLGLILGREYPLEKEMATHSNILAWRIPMDWRAWRATVHRVTKQSDTTEQLNNDNILFHIIFHILFHCGLLQETEYGSLCYTIGPCCHLS